MEFEENPPLVACANFEVLKKWAEGFFAPPMRNTPRPQLLVVDPTEPSVTLTPPCCERRHVLRAIDDLPERSLLCPCGSGVYLIRYTDENAGP